MKIIVAKNCGLCSGVKRALRLVREAAEKYGKVYTLGEIIHNEKVVDELRGQGVHPVDLSELEKIQAERGVAIALRAHGVPSAVREGLESKGFAIIDCVCPIVKALHSYANAVSGGTRIIVVGERSHPEVQALLEDHRDAIVIATPAEAMQVPNMGEAVVLFQTTFNHGQAKVIAAILMEKVKSLKVVNTICPEIVKRQKEAEALAEKADAGIVVGGTKSANTRRLVEIFRTHGKPAYRVLDPQEVDPEWVRGKQTVALLSGTSTPQEQVEAVLERLRSLAEAEVEENTGAEETQAVVSEPEVGRTPGPEETEARTEENLESIREELLKVENIYPGKILRGKVMEITDTEVIVDLGNFKAEGIMPLEEICFVDVKDPTTIVRVGDEIDVLVLRIDHEEGKVLVSRRRAERRLAWERLEKAMGEKKPVRARVIDVVKGGLRVDVGIIGFIPFSHMSAYLKENPEALVGRDIEAIPVEVNRRTNRVVLSQRMVVDNLTREAASKIKPGDVIEGEVVSVKPFGMFVALENGAIALLPASEVSWSRTVSPEEVLPKGTKTKFVVIDTKPDEGRIVLSYKRVKIPDPWNEFIRKVGIGDVLDGKVVTVKEYGAFVEVTPGIVGLLHIRDAIMGRVKTAEEVFSPGQELRVKIADIIPEEKKVRLALVEKIRPDGKREKTVASKSQKGEGK